MSLLTPSRADVRRLTADGLMLAAALILSWLEAVLPLSAPLPGFRLGLANIAVLLTAHLLGRSDALAVSLTRIFILSLLFGSAASFAFSLGGGLLALAVIVLTKPIYGRMSLIGISVLSAAAHNLGQVLAACGVFMSPAPIGMLWWLLLLSIPTGILTGLLSELLFRRLGPVIGKL